MKIRLFLLGLSLFGVGMFSHAQDSRKPKAVAAAKPHPEVQYDKEGKPLPPPPPPPIESRKMPPPPPPRAMTGNANVAPPPPPPSVPRKAVSKGNVPKAPQKGKEGTPPPPPPRIERKTTTLKLIFAPPHDARV